MILNIVTIVSITVSLVLCENVKHLSVDQVANKFWKDLKRGEHGTIDVKDLDKEFVRIFDMDGDGEVKKFEFVEKWYQNYYDSKDVAESMFDRFDIARDGKLTNLDYAAHFNAADRDSNKALSSSEFTRFIIMMHPDTRRHDEL